VGLNRAPHTAASPFAVAPDELIYYIDQGIQALAGLGLGVTKLANTPVCLFAKLSESPVRFFCMIRQRHANVNQLGDVLPILLGKPGCFGLTRFQGPQVSPELGLLLRHILFPGIEVERHEKILPRRRGWKAGVCGAVVSD
jgi:hypothetical protein